jgi:hypothetical protein
MIDPDRRIISLYEANLQYGAYLTEPTPVELACLTLRRHGSPHSLCLLPKTADEGAQRATAGTASHIYRPRSMNHEPPETHR